MADYTTVVPNSELDQCSEIAVQLSSRLIPLRDIDCWISIYIMVESIRCGSSSTQSNAYTSYTLL